MKVEMPHQYEIIGRSVDTLGSISCNSLKIVVVGPDGR